MILIDSSIWIGHLRRPVIALIDLLETDRVLGHPFILGELAMGSLPNRPRTIRAMQDLPQIARAHDHEVLTFVSQDSLLSRGIGYIDAHLLASIRLTPGTSLWTRDRRLRDSAMALGIAFDPA